MAKKLLSLLTAALMLAPAMLSCAETAPDETKEAGTPSGDVVSADTAEELETDAEITPELPADLNFDGHEFRILNNDYSIKIWAQIDICAEEMTGEPINDAVFERNAAVSDKYGCTIATEQTTDITGVLKKSILSMDGFVDVVTPQLRTFAAHAREGNYLDLHTVPTMDLSKPWYDQNSVKEVSINKLLYGAATDITIMDEQATGAYVFNKELYENYQLGTSIGSIYDVVRDGKWTMDTLSGMITTVSADLNGDGIRNANDLYGMFYQRDTLTSLFTGFNINIATKNADDIPEMTLMSEQNSDIMDRIFDMLYQEDYCFQVMAKLGESNWSDGMVSMFQNDQALLMWIRLADVENLRTMDTDFGILPMPKYTETAEGYRSAVNSYVGTLTCIPICNYDPEMTGYFIEALAYEGRRTLMPAYYEVNLQGKVSRDEESRAMLDIIFSERHYDLGEIYDPGNFANTLIYMTQTNDRDYASKWAKNERLITRSLDKMLENFGVEG